MAIFLPPPPNANTDMDDYSWKDWFRLLREYVVTAATGAWSTLNFTGSKITDIQSRQHKDLTSLQGGTTGEYYHLTNTQVNNLATLTGSGTTTLHKHDIGTATAGTGLTLKTTQYILVDIGGTTYKLALVN